MCVCVRSVRQKIDARDLRKATWIKGSPSQLPVYWQMKWTFATCVLLSWAAVNLRLSGCFICHGLQVCDDVQLLSSPAFPSVLAHFVLGSENNGKRVKLRKPTPYFSPSPQHLCERRCALLLSHRKCTSWWCQKCSEAKQCASGSGLWSSRDVIMGYQCHRMLFLNGVLSQPRPQSQPSKPGCMCVFAYVCVTLKGEGGGQLSNSLSQTHLICMLLITGPCQRLFNGAAVESFLSLRCCALTELRMWRWNHSDRVTLRTVTTRQA